MPRLAIRLIFIMYDLAAKQNIAIPAKQLLKR
jgi:hypothetical protein